MQISIDIDDLDDATVARLRAAIANVLEAPLSSPAEAQGQWTVDLALTLLRRLREMDRPVQLSVIRRLTESDGIVSRGDVYRLGNFHPDRQLKGFTRGVNSVVRDFVAEGLLGTSAGSPMRPMKEYGDEVAKGAAAFEMTEALVPIFAQAFAILDGASK
jgi:hypothetical protein